jgi:hypothetical protein
MPEERGSGIFGEWFEDETGLPAYRYEMRHDDPRAEWDPIIKPRSRLHWHQLGNERITANAYNLGMVKVFYGETGQLWLNDYDPAGNSFCGGFGWLITEDEVLIDRDDCIGKDTEWERIFGSGYFLKRLHSDGIVYERRIFAPAGDEPVIVSEVKIKNTTDKPRDLRLIEYWDVNISRITKFVLNRFLNRKIGNIVRLEQNNNGHIISAIPYKKLNGQPDRPCYIDPELPVVFLASLDDKPNGWITDPAILFKDCRPKQYPVPLDPSKGSGELRSFTHYEGLNTKQSLVLNQDKTCLATVMHTDIEPRAEKVFRFAYGYAKAREPEQIVASVISRGAHLWKNTSSFWKESAPSLKTINDESSLARELAWDNYYFNSSSQYDAYYQRHYIPQAGNYLYDAGLNGASRDFFENILTLTYYKPQAAREMLEFMVRAQKTDGSFFYSFDGFGKRNRLFYQPSDLGLWFLWALCEYVFATRDFGFLEASVPYYPLNKCIYGTVWEHAKKAFYHLIYKVGTGRHGHLKIRLSDWNDEMTWLTGGDNLLDILMTILRGESVLNTAMACHILPMFEGLTGYTGDTKTKESSAGLLSQLRIALNKAWHKDHLIRSYSGLGKPFGTEETWLEPLVWALLAKGSLQPDKESAAIKTIREKLLTQSGIKISDSGTGSMTTRKGEQESGGIWFAINAPAAIALSGFDKTLSWEVFKKNTLAWHAGLYPDKWYGIWSGPDAFNSPDSARPGESWYQKSPVFSLGAQAYPVQNIHAHSQMMYALAKLAGISAGADGWTISYKIPHEIYSFSCSLFGVDVSPERISGYACLPVSAFLKLNIELPNSLTGEKVFVDGQQVPAQRIGNFLELSSCLLKGKRVAWDIF